MKLTVPNIIKSISLSDYAPEFGEQKVHVWVNPRRETRKQLIEVVQKPTEVTNEQLADLLSVLWSAGPEGEGFTPEEVTELGTECMERAPQLWSWLVLKTIQMVNEHYIGKKKNTPEP